MTPTSSSPTEIDMRGLARALLELAEQQRKEEESDR
jgi:hypothetical protein